jgi:hypothetical protein
MKTSRMLYIAGAGAVGAGILMLLYQGIALFAIHQSFWGDRPSALGYVGLLAGLIILVGGSGALPTLALGWGWKLGFGASLVAHILATLIVIAVLPRFELYRNVTAYYMVLICLGAALTMVGVVVSRQQTTGRGILIIVGVAILLVVLTLVVPQWYTALLTWIVLPIVASRTQGEPQPIRWS